MLFSPLIQMYSTSYSRGQQYLILILQFSESMRNTWCYFLPPTELNVWVVSCYHDFLHFPARDKTFCSNLWIRQYQATQDQDLANSQQNGTYVVSQKLYLDYPVAPATIFPWSVDHQWRSAMNKQARKNGSLQEKIEGVIKTFCALSHDNTYNDRQLSNLWWMRTSESRIPSQTRGSHQMNIPETFQSIKLSEICFAKGLPFDSVVARSHLQSLCDLMWRHSMSRHS